MLELIIILCMFVGGYAASIYSWPTIKIWANGWSAEAQNLRTKAAQLEAEWMKRAR